MKITKRQLKTIIKEEKSKIIKEMMSQDRNASYELYRAFIQVMEEAKMKGLDPSRFQGLFQDALNDID